MKIPTDLQPLVDGDILRYEIGYAAEVAWRKASGNDTIIPPWDFVQSVLEGRLLEICNACKTKRDPIIYLTEGRTFRDDIATTKPYKGHRPSTKPWHYDNLSAYMRGTFDVRQMDSLEADDVMAIDSIERGDTIICSRDKDLRQVPGWFYSWELGKQPSFGPTYIEREGTLLFKEGKVQGTGLAWFYAQMLMGDPVDNIPGVSGCGPAKCWKLLEDATGQRALGIVREAYEHNYPYMLEQGKLLWIVRRLDEYNNPVTYEIGMEE